MSSKTFAARLATLEQLEAAQARPSFACVHPADYAALSDPATPAATRQAIAEAYQIGSDQKMYVGLCCCWDGEACRVCSDQPVVGK